MTTTRESPSSLTTDFLLRKDFALGEAERIKMVIRDIDGGKVIFPGTENEAGLALFRTKAELIRFKLWQELQVDCGLTPEQAYRRVGIIKDQSKPAQKQPRVFK